MDKLNKRLKDNPIYFHWIVGLIALASYGYMISNFVINNDSIERVAGANEERLKVGRFLLETIYEVLFNNTLHPALNILGGVVFLMIGSYLIIKILNINNYIQKILIYLIILSYPAFVFFVAYGNDFFAYNLAFLFAVSSIYFLEKNGIKNKIISVLFLIASLGIYQALLVIASGLYILKKIIDILEKKEIKLSKIFKDIVILLVACILYFILVIVLQKIYGIEMSSYRGANSFGISELLLNLPHTFIESYKEFIRIILKRPFMFNTTYNYIFLNLVLCLTYFLVYLKKINKKNLIWLIGLNIFFIPAMYSINFVIGNFYDYILFGFLIFEIGSIYMLKFINNKYLKMCLIILIFIFGVFNIEEINSYNLKTVTYTNTAQDLTQKIYFDLLEQPGYEKDSPVIIKGNLAKNEKIEMSKKVPFEQQDVFLHDTFPGFTGNSENTRIYMLIEMLGYEIHQEAEEKNSIDEKKFKEANIFPENGYIYEENGTYVVKLSDNI